jgi:hypothetical protein
MATPQTLCTPSTGQEPALVEARMAAWHESDVQGREAVRLSALRTNPLILIKRLNMRGFVQTHCSK